MFKRTLKAYIIFEFKRLPHNKIIVISALIIAILALLFTQLGILKYKALISQKEVFLEIEKMKVKRYINYTQYGGYGFRTFFEPPPLSILFTNTTVADNVTAFVDSGERLKIYQSIIGGNMFKVWRYSIGDFSGIVIMFGGLLVMYYMYCAFGGREFHRFTASLAGAGQVFFGLFLARLLITWLFFTGLTLLAVGLILLNDLPLSIDHNLLSYITVLLLTTMFFSTLGAIAGNLKQRKVGLAVLMSAWLVLVFALPAGLGLYVQWRANKIKAHHQLEMEKFKLLMDFEERAIKEKATIKYGERLKPNVQEMVKSYRDNEFIRIHQLEEDTIIQMRALGSLNSKCSILFPTSFYSDLSSNLSGGGFLSLLEFYDQVQETKKHFFEFYMDCLYFSGEDQNADTGGVKPFGNGSENLFIGDSKVPHFFYTGLLLTVIYLSFCSWAAFHLFRKSMLLHPASFKIFEQRCETNIMIDQLCRGQLKVLVGGSNEYLHYLYSLLSGFKTRKSRIKIEGINLHKGEKEADFAYLCHPQYFPGDSTPTALISFALRLTGRKNNENITNYNHPHGCVARFSLQEKGRLFLALAELNVRPVYLFNDTAKEMTLEFAVRLTETMERLKKNNSLVIYFTSSFPITLKTGKVIPTILDGSRWTGMLDYYKELLEKDINSGSPVIG